MTEPVRIPPHDEHAESCLVAAILEQPGFLEKLFPALKPEDFFFHNLRTIYSAAVSVMASGDSPTIPAVRNWLADHGTLEQAGGDDGIVELVNNAPFVLEPSREMGRILEASRLRKTIAHCQLIEARAYTGVEDVPAFLSEAASCLSELATGPNTEQLSMVDRAMALGANLTRLRTGFETLDRITRGGLPTTKRLFIVGPPGASKTGMAVDMAFKMAQSGACVLFLAVDEEPDAILIRIGQMFGLDREALERGEETARRMLADYVRDFPLRIVDGAMDDGTIEQQSKELAKWANGRPSVLVIDSIQHVRCLASEGAEDTRRKIDGTIHAIKSASYAGHLVIATSEAGRAFYRSKAKNEQSDGLSAGKESSAIEYAATVLLTLRSVRDVANETEVEVAKNRLGPKGDMFRLRLNFSNASYHEVEGDAVGTQEDADAEERARFDLVCRRVLDAVRTHPGLKSKRQVLAVAKGKQGPVFEAIDELLAIGRLVKLSSGFVANHEPSEGEES